MSSTYAAGPPVDEGPKISKKGFLLSVDDPFAREVLSLYAKSKESSEDLQLPFVLPYDDPKTKDAIKNYIVRASGGCDTERTFDARLGLR